ncbi:MAG: hypothetical protein GY814_14935, partial [Gammaproteobacteria bacterium]|nr:hypothetical protein [Gammaproteobacteria bacterium]
MTPTVLALQEGVRWFEGDPQASNHATYVGNFNPSPAGDDPDNNWCASNHMLLLSYGRPNSDHINSYKGESCEEDELMSGTPGRGQCSQESVEGAWNTERTAGGDGDTETDNGPAQQNITTHTIYLGEAFNGNMANYMAGIADAGGGESYLAASAADLVDAFNHIVADAQQNISYSYSAPVIPFSADNAA